MAFWGKGSRPSRRGDHRSQQPKTSVEAVSTTPAPPLGPLLHSLRKDDISATISNYVGSATISQCQVVTSYNWLDKKGSEQTIIIPGKPPKWTPLSYPTVLAEDSGQFFRDRNAAHFPKHPMEPAAVAALSADPRLPSEIDVFACGSTIGSLLRFVRGDNQSFRMLVEKVHHTVFLTRRENSPTELIPGVRGFGHTFPDAYTSWDYDVKGSTSNQRLIRYRLGGLEFVVRNEADGYISEKGARLEAAESVQAYNDARAGRSGGEKDLTTTEIDELSSSMAGLTGQMAGNEISLTATGKSVSSELKMIRAGSLVEQSRVFDLKTRSVKTIGKKDHLDAELPRLWVRQIPNFVLAYHANGLFKRDTIEVMDTRAKIQDWEKDHTRDIAYLVALVHEIIALVSAEPTGKIELCKPAHKTGVLEVRAQLPDAGDALSPAVKALWESSASASEDA